ncbi:glycosyltransferase [Stenotrophomonas sp. W1S232]|uniref:Glycosyltransferase n=1 Tax=Stenotrophomonas koreensis TaxID=266128 RepID=A0A7W3YTF0_9GAMM|nr:glycosyltransferase [Stenotrophomonas koreensis]MBB1115966.1 glycosyltransferase [Stenotrophomonas koreensis]
MSSVSSFSRQSEPAVAISILIAVRNEAAHLAKTLDAIEAANGAMLEVLIIDGQSSDDTVAIAKRFTDRLPQWRIVDNPRKLSAAGWNIGLAEARAPIVMLLSGHALVQTGYFDAMLSSLTPDRTGVGTRAVPVGEDARSELIALAFSSRLGNGGASFMTDSVAGGPVESIAFGCYWREPLLAIGGFDENIVRGQDWDLNLRLRSAGHILWYEPGMEIRYTTRATYRALWRRQYLAGLWKDYIHKKSGKPFLMRHWVPAVFVACMIGPLVIAPIWPAASLISLGGGVAHFAAAFRQGQKLGLSWRNALPFWWALWIIHSAYGLGIWAGKLRAAWRTIVRSISGRNSQN